MSKTWNIFVINMGSTSSKVAYCQNDTIVKKTEVPHDTKELRALKTPESIVSFYKRVVTRFMEENNIDLKKMDAFAIRGVGKMASYRHGAYLLTPQVAADCAAGPLGHIGLFASTMIGNELSQKYNIPAYLYDVVPTNEVPEMACITGIPGYRRRIASHTLNCRATARKVAEQMGRELETDGLRELLERNREHPRWDEVSERCLTCGNCTMVCPTCFCTSVEDVTDLTGEEAERWREWDSCFSLDFSYVVGGSVRSSSRSRYRQWMTHKLGTWWDQFGSSGCVGCGRCITWCPVGIDVTEELANLP